ncbi:MAG: hypothetical protein ACTSVI_06800 [Promethearchaeota archaeon]
MERTNLNSRTTHPVTPILDDLTRSYARLTGRGGIRGVLLIDQDAKVLAKNSMFCLKRPWNMGAIGAALYGVAKQASLYFNCTAMERVSIIFDSLKFFVHKIGGVPDKKSQNIKEILLVILAEKHVKEGLIIVQMRKYVDRIMKEVKHDQQTMQLLDLDERAVKEYLLGIS